MEAKEKYSERRRSERRQDARRSNVRRGDVRLDSSFEASLLDHDGRTVNVSASGVYFEVITNDMAKARNRYFFILCIYAA